MTSRTLKSTPRNLNIERLEGGVELYYFKVKQTLESNLNRYSDEALSVPTTAIAIAFDGLPISKSSRTQVWPFLLTC